MFCPKCGKADQSPDAYCRSCGEFLHDPNRSNIIAFGGKTPQQNVNAINILSVLAAIASLLAAIWMYQTRFNEPIALYFGAALLLCNAFWHLSNFYTGLKLKRRLGNSKSVEESLPSATTRELLPEMNQDDLVPPSVTERTTRNLAVSENKSSPKAQQQTNRQI